ncbi:MAG TPA: trehalose-6-phosphate synthase [Acidimicrobiales bacterium]|nr:trehalose-6-phosphate synthase [Acidimicrobiales bacterium]
MAPNRLREDGEGSLGEGSLADTVMVSNRGPLSFRFDDGVPVAGEAAGGLAGSLGPMMAGTGATWVASTLGDADRAAAEAGLVPENGYQVELVDPDPEVFNLAYNVVSNSMLWFCHHHLFDASRRPRTDFRWSEAWDAYRELNEQFADRVAKVAPVGGRVLVQDYHLALMGSALANQRPDLRTVHFTHTPFADPSVLRMLPTATGNELLSSMAGFGACGFHTERWAAAYRANQSAPNQSRPEGTRSAGRAFVSALSVDPDRLQVSASDPAVSSALARIERLVGDGDRQVVVRVDRMELSKNLLRGFWAFDELLERQPARRERVVFAAFAYPTRQGLPEYLAYQNEVESTVDRINQRWARPGWTPIVLEVEDDYHASLAALVRYDVLLVNPVRDGMNLVAKEGPLVNGRDGVLVLSREAGAFEELWPAALELNPFDVSATAAALAEALDMETGQRAERSAALRRLISARRPADWLRDQLASAG